MTRSPLCDLSRFLTLAAAMVLATPRAGRGQEWSRFRGPAGQGVAHDAQLPTALGDDHVRWRVPMGRGHSSPVLWGDRLFLTREGRGERQREVVCLDANTGAVVWVRDDAFEPHAQHRLNSAAASTPVVDDLGVYVLWTSGEELIALALDHDGEKRWQRNLGPFQAQHGSGASPELCDEMLLIANEHESDGCSLLGLQRRTGETGWRVDRDAAERTGSYASPLVYQPPAPDSAAYALFASTAHGLTAVAPASGDVLWQLDLGFRARFVAHPCLVDDHALLCVGAGGGGKAGAVVRLPASADDSATIAYRPRRHLPYVPNSIGLGGRFYSFTDGGIASCLEAETGELVWRERLDGTFFSSPVSDGETIYLASKEGVLFCLAAGDEYRLHGTCALGESVFATPAIARDALYVRTAAQLICFGAAEAEDG
ncbi:MAG: PQQ-binding-like beta-propeller repeat protein [Planctomycetota bacterium]